MSHATTADDSMQMDLDKETQLLKTTQFSQLPGTTQLYTQYPGEVRPSTIDPNIKMAAQGSSPIEEYVKYGEVVVITGVKQYEVEAVKTFISGLRDKYAQQLLISRLERVGWTWEKAKEEIQRIIEEGRKRKRSRRTMPIFT